MPETIYFDTCALNRLTDDPSHQRVRQEAEAVEEVLRSVLLGNGLWIGSSLLRQEIMANTNEEKRSQALRLLRFVSREPALTPEVHRLASLIGAAGLLGMDALHLAFCSHVRVDFLLTVDDRFIRRAGRIQGIAIHTEVLNPVDWLARRMP